MVIRDPWIKALVIVMLLIAAVYLIGLLWALGSQFADVILLFFLAWVISFILDPMVAALHNRLRMPRQVAVVTTYLAVLITVSLAIIQLVPRLSLQIVQVANDLPLYADWINGELLRLQDGLGQQGIHLSPESILTYQEVVRRVEAAGPLVVANTVGLATGVANLLFQLFIILILSYYMTLDGHRLSSWLLVAVPRGYRNDVLYFLVSVNRAFAGFMRGQIAQALLYAFGTALVMSLTGLNLILLSSVLAALFMLLPFVGPFLAMALPLIVSAVTKPNAFLPTLLTLFILQQVVVNVIAPRLMSRTVGLHPLLVFMAVLGGAKLAGVWGALFGVPVVGVVGAMVSFYRATVEDREARLRRAGTELPDEEDFQPELAEAAPAVERPRQPVAAAVPLATSLRKDAPPA